MKKYRKYVNALPTALFTFSILFTSIACSSTQERKVDLASINKRVEQLAESGKLPFELQAKRKENSVRPSTLSPDCTGADCKPSIMDPAAASVASN